MTRVTRLIALTGSSLAVAAMLAVGAQGGVRPDDRAGTRGPGASHQELVSRADARARASLWGDARVGAGVAIVLVLLMGRPSPSRTGAATRSPHRLSPTGEST
jgi:hypothetical protein